VPDRPKPLLTAALTCERLLHEKDEVVSAIRIVDTFVVPPPPPDVPPDSVAAVRLAILIAFKSGDASGQYSVSLVVRKPDGQSEVLTEQAIDLRGGNHGVNLNIEFMFAVRDMGLYWIDVLLDGERVTSMPVTLKRPPHGPSTRPQWQVIRSEPKPQ
jgi:hypothetical protein